jgi:collagenase-like PrtC family protease
VFIGGWILLVAASPRCAVSQVFDLPNAAREQRCADYKSAIRQIENLRYGKQITVALRQPRHV